MLLGWSLGNRARLNFDALAERELLAAYVFIWPDRSDARGLVRRAAPQRYAAYGWTALDDPGGPSAAKRDMGFRHGVAAKISPKQFQVASLMRRTDLPNVRGPRNMPRSGSEAESESSKTARRRGE